MEDEVRAAPPRRINRDRETRPLSHSPLSLAALFSLLPHPTVAVPFRGHPSLWLLFRASILLRVLRLSRYTVDFPKLKIEIMDLALHVCGRKIRGI